MEQAVSLAGIIPWSQDRTPVWVFSPPFCVQDGAPRDVDGVYGSLSSLPG